MGNGPIGIARRGSSLRRTGSATFEAMEALDYRQIITIDPEWRFGKPCVRGTRITVFDVLSWLAAGMSHAEILANYPQLKKDDIRACLAFAPEREQTLKRAT